MTSAKMMRPMPSPSGSCNISKPCMQPGLLCVSKHGSSQINKGLTARGCLDLQHWHSLHAFTHNHTVGRSSQLACYFSGKAPRQSSSCHISIPFFNHSPNPSVLSAHILLKQQGYQNPLCICTSALPPFSLASQGRKPPLTSGKMRFAVIWAGFRGWLP